MIKAIVTAYNGSGLPPTLRVAGVYLIDGVGSPTFLVTVPLDAPIHIVIQRMLVAIISDALASQGLVIEAGEILHIDLKLGAR